VKFLLDKQLKQFEEIKSLSKEIENLHEVRNRQLSIENEKLMNANFKITRLTEDLQKLRDILHKVIPNPKTPETTTNELFRYWRDLHEMFDETTEENLKLKEQIQALTRLGDDLRSERQKARKERDEINMCNKVLEDSNRDLKKEISRLERKRNDKNKTITALIDTIDIESSKIDEARKQEISKNEKEIGDTKRTIEILEENLSQWIKMCADGDRKIKTLEQRLLDHIQWKTF
jgi:hypothetical protein